MAMQDAAGTRAGGPETHRRSTQRRCGDGAQGGAAERSEGPWPDHPGAARDRSRALRLLHRVQHDRQPSQRRHLLRLRIPRQPGRLRHQPDADRLCRDVELRARLHRGAAQHASHSRGRCRSRDGRRLRRRHRAALQQLDREPGRLRLCRVHPQHSAAAADLHLVFRGPAPAAGQARRAGPRPLRQAQRRRPLSP